MAPPASPPEERLFCPFQGKVDDIMTQIWNTSRGLQGWLNLLEAMKRRQTSLSPFTIVSPQGNTIPVTPLKNPKTKMSSHFFVQMIDDDDDTFKVNCLIRDIDLYFMGFQRELTEQGLEDKERTEAEATSSKGQVKRKKTVDLSAKGDFFRFVEDDMTVPDFLNAKKLNISAGYMKSAEPGGKEAFRHMFRTFSRYQDGRVTDHELEIACYCFMGTVCEPSRLRSLHLEVARRVAAGEFPSPLSHFLLGKVNNWTQLGKVVLNKRLVDGLGLYRLLPEWCRRHNLVIMRELIGKRGELLLIRISTEFIGIPEERLKEIAEKAAKRNTGPACRLDPGFEVAVVN